MVNLITDQRRDWGASMIDGFSCYAPTLTQAKTIQAGNLEKACKILGVEFGRYNPQNHSCTVDGWPVFLIPLGQANAYSNWDGYTFGASWFEEVISLDRESVRIMEQRCSLDASKMLYSTNPHSKYHWFFTDYINQLEVQDAIRYRMYFEDNPAMWENPGYVHDLIRTTFGAIRQRRVYGEWASAEGLVYPNYEKCLVDGQPSGTQVVGYDLWVDYGTRNATAIFKANFLSDGRVYVEREWYWRTAQDGFLGPKSQFERCLDETGWNNPRRVIYDDAALHFGAAVDELGYHAIPADKGLIDEGVQQTTMLIENEDLIVNAEGCPNLMSEFSLYEWDEASANTDKDVPNPRTPHDGLDAFRYGALNIPRRRYR